QHSHRDGRLERGRQVTGADARLQLREDLSAHLTRKREALVRLADARYRPLEKHQREILRMLAAELVEALETAARLLERRHLLARLAAAAVAEQPEALFGERKKDVVLAREVAVNRRGAVFDPLRNLADRHVLKALADEQLARGVEDRSPHRFAVALLAFFDA